MAAWEAPAARMGACASPLSMAAAAAVVLCVVANAPQARAAGYAVGQESVSGMGLAYAGGAAAAGDVATVFSNPAGMTRLKGTQFMFGGAGIFPVVDYDEQSSVLLDGTSVSGNEGGDGGQNALVPHFYIVHSLENGIKLGLSVNSPFGLVTNYEEQWLGRYSEITTSLKSFNFNPSIAGTVLPGLSVGAGVSVQYQRGNLLQAIDFGSFCQIVAPAACAGNNLEPGQDDGLGRVKGDAVGYGFNIGALYELNERTRFGAHYRSRMNFNYDARGKFLIPANARAFLNSIGLTTAFTKADADFILVQPEMASVSAYHDMTDRWSVMADVTWTRWGVFDKLLIQFDNQTPDNLLVTEWDNVFRYSLGTTYKWKPDVILRAGFAYDDSPIDTEFRGPGIPDSDRIILAVGLGYAYSDTTWIDLGYQHMFFKTGNTRRVSATNSVLSGDFNVSNDVFGISFTTKW